MNQKILPLNFDEKIGNKTGYIFQLKQPGVQENEVLTVLFFLSS